MSDTQPFIDEVDLLLDNARLRDELEPYIDESVDSAVRMPLSVENEYLASMLAWERAPAMPIAQWFNPPLQLPHPDSLDAEQVHELLTRTIDQLYQANVASAVHRPSFGSPALHDHLSRHPALLRKEGRSASQLPPLALLG